MIVRTQFGDKTASCILCLSLQIGWCSLFTRRQQETDTQNEENAGFARAHGFVARQKQHQLTTITFFVSSAKSLNEKQLHSDEWFSLSPAHFGSIAHTNTQKHTHKHAHASTILLLSGQKWPILALPFMSFFKFVSRRNKNEKRNLRSVGTRSLTLSLTHTVTENENLNQR